MTRALPPMASFSELVGTALRAATGHLAEGSRRNAREALEVRYELTRQGREVMAALPARHGRPPPAAAAAAALAPDRSGASRPRPRILPAMARKDEGHPTSRRRRRSRAGPRRSGPPTR